MKSTAPFGPHHNKSEYMIFHDTCTRFICSLFFFCVYLYWFRQSKTFITQCLVHFARVFRPSGHYRTCLTNSLSFNQVVTIHYKIGNPESDFQTSLNESPSEGAHHTSNNGRQATRSHLCCTLSPTCELVCVPVRTHRASKVTKKFSHFVSSVVNHSSDVILASWQLKLPVARLILSYQANNKAIHTAGPLWGESTGHGGFSSQRAGDAKKVFRTLTWVCAAIDLATSLVSRAFYVDRYWFRKWYFRANPLALINVSSLIREGNYF